MYDELKNAWKEFQRLILEPFATKFREEIAKKLRSEFYGLDLR